MASPSEGKVMSESSKQCGSCKSNTSTKYCADCMMPLCNMCSDIHKNIPLTQNHNIGDVKASGEGSIPKAAPGKCSVHSVEDLTCLCNYCEKLLCNSCKTGHDGHELMPLSNDPKVYQKVCEKHIQHLIEDLHEIEELKSVLEGHITTYNEAMIVVDKWEHDLMKMINDKAAKIRQRIKHLKDEKFKLLGDKVKGMAGKLREIDISITQLSSIRKSMDTGILANELSKSQEIIRKLEAYKSELGSFQPAKCVDRMLPDDSKIKDVDKALDQVFSMNYFEEPGDNTAKVTKPLPTGPHPVAEWVFTSANCGNDLSQYGENPVSLKNIVFGRGPDGEPNSAVILPTSADQSMIVMNPSEKLRFSSEMTYFTNFYLTVTENNTSSESMVGVLFEYSSIAKITEERKTQNIAGGLFVVTGAQQDTLLLSVRMGVDGFASTEMQFNTWNKLAVVWTSTTNIFYVNGIEVHKEEKPQNKYRSLQVDGNIHMGRCAGVCNVYNLPGRIACAQFYNRALSQEEIAALDCE